MEAKVLKEEKFNDDRDVDIESYDDDDDDSVADSQQSQPNCSQAQKRAHHNALERKRRDHLKESFANLRDAVPSLRGEKNSRAQTLKKATESIKTMRRKIALNRKDIEDIRKQNAIVVAEIRRLQAVKAARQIDQTKCQQLTQSDQQQDSLDSTDQDFSYRSKKK